MCVHWLLRNCCTLAFNFVNFVCEMKDTCVDTSCDSGWRISMVLLFFTLVRISRILYVKCLLQVLASPAMANSKGSSTVRNMMYNGKNPLLPPKSPFPSISPSYSEYVPTSVIGSKALPKPRDGNPHH